MNEYFEILKLAFNQVKYIVLVVLMISVMVCIGIIQMLLTDQKLTKVEHISEIKRMAQELSSCEFNLKHERENSILNKLECEKQQDVYKRNELINESSCNITDDECKRYHKFLDINNICDLCGVPFEKYSHHCPTHELYELEQEDMLYAKQVREQDNKDEIKRHIIESEILETKLNNMLKDLKDYETVPEIEIEIKPEE